MSEYWIISLIGVIIILIVALLTIISMAIDSYKRESLKIDYEDLINKQNSKIDILTDYINYLEVVIDVYEREAK